MDNGLRVDNRQYRQWTVPLQQYCSALLLLWPLRDDKRRNYFAIDWLADTFSSGDDDKWHRSQVDQSVSFPRVTRFAFSCVVDAVTLFARPLLRERRMFVRFTDTDEDLYDLKRCELDGSTYEHQRVTFYGSRYHLKTPFADKDEESEEGKEWESRWFISPTATEWISI